MLRAMQLLLIRHALPVRIDGGDGPADPHLSDTGHHQAEALAHWLADEQIDEIWTSPMRRARETAAPLEAALGLTAVVDDELREFDAEESHYIPMEELRGTDDPRWRELIERLGSPEQYAFRDLCAAAVERAVVANPGRTVAVVCHGGVVNAYLSSILHIERPLFFEPAYTSVSRVMAASSGMRSLVSVNEVAHMPTLRAGGRTPGRDGDAAPGAAANDIVARAEEAAVESPP
ncbi:MAG: histidine phosphatase family protein [Acidimicrobiia bacterium]|nr:histidine phosphatase family protein [Acidimicrobiia bacterium]